MPKGANHRADPQALTAAGGASPSACFVRGGSLERWRTRTRTPKGPCRKLVSDRSLSRSAACYPSRMPRGPSGRLGTMHWVRFNEAYEEWRNPIRSYDLASIIGVAVDALSESSPDPVAEVAKAPWLTLLLVKWVCQDTGLDGTPSRAIRVAAREKALMNKIREGHADVHRQSRGVRRAVHAARYLR